MAKKPEWKIRQDQKTKAKAEVEKRTAKVVDDLTKLIDDLAVGGKLSKMGGGAAPERMRYLEAALHQVRVFRIGYRPR